MHARDCDVMQPFTLHRCLFHTPPLPGRRTQRRDTDPSRRMTLIVRCLLSPKLHQSLQRTARTDLLFTEISTTSRFVHEHQVSLREMNKQRLARTVSATGCNN